MRDRDTGRSREANNAIANMNEQEVDGRRIKVNLANPRSSATGGGGGGAAFGGGYGGAGGYSGSWQVCKYMRVLFIIFFRWRRLRSAA
ncbi:hypothetical protein BDR07DRAFT_1418091 [Suillus spraguei]|nr:hypothetical protein BDR07DRAFT_1418091 [Suillus spraguei]